MLDGEAGVEEREAGRALGLIGAHHEQDARDYEGDPERRPHSSVLTQRFADKSVGWS
jgi:hypothetical protein